MFQVLLHRRKTFVMMIVLVILAIVLAVLFERARTGSRPDITRKQEIEREAIKKGAEEHMKLLRGNPSEMAKKAFESQDKKKKTTSPRKEERKDEKK